MAGNIITNPNGFFEELKEKEVNLKTPVLIIFIISLIGAISQFFIMDKLAGVFPEEAAGVMRIIGYTGIITVFITMLVMWGIISAILHITSSFLGGSGPFKRTLQVTGYGFIPILISSLISTPVLIYFVSNARVPNISMADLQSGGDFMIDFMRILMPPDYVYFSLLISIAFSVWALMIWAFGIKQSRGLPLNKAIISALVPFVAYVGYTGYSLSNFL